MSLSTTRDQGEARVNYVLVSILALTSMKLVFAGLLPLSGDESLYWLESRHLAPGYIDHPPMNPLMIRLGTSVFGDTPFGVRVMGILLGLPATWAVWRSAALLFKDDGLASLAALFFNLTTVMTLGSAAATSDTVVVLTSAFLLYFLSALNATGRGQWWLAVGAAFGLGMVSKYTTAFFAISVLAWLILLPQNRRWLFSPWPWAAGVLAAAIFSPVIYWNSQHQWASFTYQAHRMIVARWSVRYVGELIGSQLLLATPPIFVLGCVGLSSGWKTAEATLSSRVLLAALVAPIPAYFLWHSLHERVQGNWPEPIYPAFAIAAALAARQLQKEEGVLGAVVHWARRLAVPVGLAIPAAAYLQSAFGIVPLGAADPSTRILAVGWKDLAPKIDAAAERLNAPVILTTDYTTTGWLDFYRSAGIPVVQINERIRWIDAPAPKPALFRGTMLYVCKAECAYLDDIKRSFAHVDLVDTARREARGALITTYSLFRVSDPTQPVLDPVYPPMQLLSR